ncbi:hypothetical protein GGI21_004199 [Coemansia aciculifera]|nr:hypothetical protein GGI21_004199 [Coemansia aciculifera]
MPDIATHVAPDARPDHPKIKKGACPVSIIGGTAVAAYHETQQDERMRQALKLLAPTQDDFRLVDYATRFNWPEMAAEYASQLSKHSDLPSRDKLPATWYAVVFRSKRRTDCNNVDLFEADRLAYNEAFSTTNGSLLKYWYCDLDKDNNCLATCVWTSRDLARSVNLLPRHREAARLSAGSYVHYNIDRYQITWLDDKKKFDVMQLIDN